MRWMVWAVILVGCGAALRDERPEMPPAEVADVTDPNVLQTWGSARLVRYAFEPFVPPEPPMQGSPWEPPEGIDPALAEMVREVYAAGYPDPRGCPYRMVGVQQRSLWDEGEVVRVPMFVLPGATAALGWDGVVRRALSVGEPADLEAHAALVRDAIAAADAEHQASLYSAELRALGLLGTTSYSVTMARLGLDVGLAPEPQRAADVVAGSHHALARHALLAFMRGDDDEALYALDRLDRLDPLPESTPVVLDGDVRELRPQLRIELTRRIAASTRLEIDGDRLHADLADVPTDVLIGALDEVRARQLGQPGGLNFLWEPVPRALVARGEEVVEALIDVLERDPRATRSVHFWRDFAPPRTLSAVYEVAYVVLTHILDWSLFEARCTGCDLTNAGGDARARVATAMRAFWTANGRRTPAQRMLAVLADDDAEPDAWAQAGRRLVAPSETTDPEVPIERVVQQLSDEERARFTPLLIARLATARERATSTYLHDAECGLAMTLVRWDAVGGREALAAQAQRCLGGEIYCACRVPLTRAVAALDSTIAADFAQFLRVDQHVTIADLVLAGELREDGGIAAALTDVFGVGAAGWNRSEIHSLFRYDQLGRALYLPEVKAEVVRRLGACEGTIRVETAPDRIVFATESSWRRLDPPGDVELGEYAGTIHDCDAFAFEVGRAMVRPTFPVWGSDEERAAARAELVERVRAWTFTPVVPPLD